MKCSVIGFAFLVAFAFTANAANAPSNPVARVVGLLKSLSAKVEAEGKAEEELYEGFMCWGKSVISSKKASNSAAQMRIEELTSVIGDLDSGKTELTSERTDLEAEIQTLNEEKEAATALREKEQADFEMAESETKQAIAALKSAIATLTLATQNHTEGTLLSIRAQVKQGMSAGGLAALKERASMLDKAIEISDRVLHHADATFLRRLLTGDVPTVDWKKLNRKATFKMSYKARSFKIQKVLADMLETFEAKLSEMQTKEGDAIAAYNKLSGDKQAQLTSAEDARASMTKEKGAKQLSRSEASDEVDALKAQILADNGFIGQTQDSMKTKTEEWKARQELRSGELAAISKAISILHNDESRDLFRKSFASHGYLLLQESTTMQTSERARLNKAVVVLRHLASVTNDKRLLGIAPFSQNETVVIKPAIDAIDLLIQKLKEDEADDLAKKESCEDDRATDTRGAIKASRTIDEKNDLITQLTEEIAELTSSIATTTEHQKATEAELAEATANREAELKEFELDKKDDEDADAVVLSAKSALSTFYASNNLMLVQQPVTAVAGDAPPPPPKTWKGGYLGATADSTGILAILAMIHEDIRKDIAKAQAEEDEAVSVYGKFKKEAEASILADKGTISDLTGTRGSKQGAKTTATSERTTEKTSLNGLLATIKTKASSGCDYFAVNYKLRRSNRQIELDGLTKAKAYLQGGDFSKVDPNREIKPGDAALLSQRHALRR